MVPKVSDSYPSNYPSSNRSRAIGGVSAVVGIVAASVLLATPATAQSIHTVGRIAAATHGVHGDDDYYVKSDDDEKSKSDEDKAEDKSKSDDEKAEDKAKSDDDYSTYGHKREH